MKKKRFTEAQIIQALKAHESGRTGAEICRELGVSQAAFYRWKKKYSGMEAFELKRLKELEAENRKLKQMYADLALDNQTIW
jgi:putative transposase